MEVLLWLTEALLVAGEIEWWLLKQEEQSSLLCLTEAVLSQLFVLKFCRMLKPSFVMIDESQPDNWHSIFQSAKAVLVTPFEILDILRWEWDGFFRATRLNKKHRKSYLFRVIDMFEPGLLQQMKPGSIILDWGQRGNPWNGTIPILPGKKLKKSPSPGEVMITVFWHCEGVVFVNVMHKLETFNSNAYIRTLTELRNHFKRIQPHQNPTEILLHHDIAKSHTCL